MYDLTLDAAESDFNNLSKLFHSVHMKYFVQGFLPFIKEHYEYLSSEQYK